MKKELKRRPVALVTGGGKRLGRKIALALAGNGFDVAVNYNESKKGAWETVRLAKKLGAQAIAVRADISQKKDVSRMVRQAQRTFGGIDLLVNNSAIFTQGSILDTSEKAWDTTIDINLKGMFLCSQAVAPIMIKQGRGTIVNIASLGGLQAWSKHLPYSVSKAGAIMLTKCMAKSLAPSIRVNAIAPGTIILPGEEDASQQHIDRKKIPLQKYGKSSDVTDLVIYLATKSQYITGQIFVVDGGRSISL